MVNLGENVVNRGRGEYCKNSFSIQWDYPGFGFYLCYVLGYVKYSGDDVVNLVESVVD